MSQNRLGIATVALIALIGITVWRLGSREAEDAPPAQATVKLPKIDKDKVDELVLSVPDKGTVRLVKKDTEWRLVEPVDALADQEAVSNALVKLVELEVSGVAATKAKNHVRLEVDATKGTHVVVKSGGKPMLDAWIGAYQSGNSMLRLEGQEPVATVRGSIRYAFSKHVREWRDRQITDLPTDSVKQITFVNKTGRLQFARDAEDWKQITGKGEKPIAPLDVSKVKGVVGTAAVLTAVDFAEPGVTPEQAGLGEGAATVTLDLEDDKGKQQVVYRIGNQKEQSYFLQKQGVDTVFLVSQWIGGRLTPAPDAFVKKEEPAAAAPPAGLPGADPHAGIGSPMNPIQIDPAQLGPATKAAAEKAAAAAKGAPAKPAAAKPAPTTKPAQAKPATGTVRPAQ
jgi:hypothetical protein